MGEKRRYAGGRKQKGARPGLHGITGLDEVMPHMACREHLYVTLSECIGELHDGNGQDGA